MPDIVAPVEPDVPVALSSLRALSDEEVVELHDRSFETETKGSRLYIDELNRRAGERQAAASNHLARVAIGIAICSFVVAVIAVGVALVVR